MKPEQQANGLFCWIDLNSRDAEKARDFYAAVFGWTYFEAMPTHEGAPPYGFFLKDGKTAAGIGQMNDEMKASGMPSMWANYVRVPDAEATAAKVAENGGSVMFPVQDAGPAGRLAFFTDPEGAVFAVWQPGEHNGAEDFNAPGFPSWNELYTRDPERAIDFYGKVFDWTFEPMEGTPTSYSLIKNGGRNNGGVL